jgi:NodT family efflux transporter outer membrane factor (OMF) lipoprotein
MAPDAEVPALVAELPTAFEGAEVGAYRPAAWWQGFDDPVLNSLVADALSDNLDIAAAAARIERARAQARLSRAALLPTLSASAGASYSDTPLAGTAFGDFGGGTLTRLTNEAYTLGLTASYELDIFGRASSDLRAARADALAAAADFRAVQLAAAAETIQTYFDVVDLRRQIDLNLATVETLRDRVRRTEERYQRGLSESFELYQVRQDLRAAEAALPQRESALANAEGRLALLTRRYPGQLDAVLAAPLQPQLVFEPVPAGLPAELLSQRPDVAAGWIRLQAARERIGARRAERFPRLALTANPGTQGGDINGALNFDDNWSLSLAANLTAPIFDAGRISANIAAARAAYDEQAATYAAAVLGAFREVDAAIEDYEERRQRYRLILSQLREAESTETLQGRRFQAGVGNYVGFLDARRARLQVEASLSTAARDVAVARLGVHRALGGDWTAADQLAPAPLDMTDIPEIPTDEGDGA